MKKMVISFVCGALLSLTTAAAASDTIQAYLFPAKFQINGMDKQPSVETPVLRYNGSAYVPIRFVAEALGAQVEFEEGTSTIKVDGQVAAGTTASGLKTQTIETLEVDLDNDGTLEKLELVVDVGEDGSPFVWRVLVDGGLRAFLTQPDNGMYGPTAHMEVNDLTGDGKPELLVYRYNTGTSGAIGLTVYQPSIMWSPIFAVADPFRYDGMDRVKERYEVRYLGNLKIEFTDKETGMKAVVPQDPVKYKGIQAKQLQEWLKNLETWVDPISFYKIKDLDGDGKMEILTTQRVIGIGHPDTVAMLENIYQLHDDRSYHPVMQKVYDYKEHLIAEKKRVLLK